MSPQTTDQNQVFSAPDPASVALETAAREGTTDFTTYSQHATDQVVSGSQSLADQHSYPEWASERNDSGQERHE